MSDLISRQDAIEGVKELFACADVENDECDITYMLENLPSADRLQGKQINGGQETMSMVSKQIEELRKYAKKWSEWNGFDAAMPILPCTNIRLLQSAADTIETLNRPTGEWIEDGYCDRQYICSYCGGSSGTQFDGVQPIPLKTKYCPNCGAYMKGNEL